MRKPQRTPLEWKSRCTSPRHGKHRFRNEGVRGIPENLQKCPGMNKSGFRRPAVARSKQWQGEVTPWPPSLSRPCLLRLLQSSRSCLVRSRCVRETRSLAELSSPLQASQLQQKGAARGDLPEWIKCYYTGRDQILTNPRLCLWIKVTESLFLWNKFDV